MGRSRPGDGELSPTRREEVARAVIEAAWNHLEAPDADRALAYYRPHATVVTDGRLYESFDAFVADTREFYSTLREVHTAAWDRPRVTVLGDDAAVFTAQVRWASTDSAGLRIDLRGVWTAVWLRGSKGWQIAVRHESFLPDADVSSTGVDR